MSDMVRRNGLLSLTVSVCHRDSHHDLHPATMTRVIITTLLAVIALLVLSTVAAPVAVGADAPALFVPPEPTRTAEHSATAEAEWVPLPVVPEPTGELLQVPSICDESHWILSIRHCPQDCPRCACRFEFDVTRADWHGNGQPSSMAELQNWLTPGLPVCVMVHGSFVTTKTVAEDSRNTFRWLREVAPHLPLQVIFVTWPSDGIFTLDPAVAASSLIPNFDVGILGRRAELNGCRLARLVQSLPPESPVCLVGHSHGARMVTSACHFLGGGELHGIRVTDRPCHRVRAILAAAAVDHDWIVPGQRYDRALDGAQCMLNLQSSFDWALGIYPLRRPFSRRALGQSGFTSGDLRRLGDRSQQVANFDVSKELGIGHTWPRYYERPEIAAALVPWIYFTE
ncbi:MAG: hypothetical protein ACYTGL_25870 [Planctomycetota bacterium]